MRDVEAFEPAWRCVEVEHTLQFEQTIVHARGLDQARRQRLRRTVHRHVEQASFDAALRLRDRHLAARTLPKRFLQQFVFVDGVADENLRRSEEHTSELQSLMRIPYD